MRTITPSMLPLGFPPAFEKKHHESVEQLHDRTISNTHPQLEVLDHECGLMLLAW